MEFTIRRNKGTRNNPKDEGMLTVNSDIHFDSNWVFCGKPYMYLHAVYDKPMYGWKPYQIAVCVNDRDDFDIGVVYSPTREQFFDVLHEVINWLHDLEMGLCLYGDFVDGVKQGDFFPVLNCERSNW